MCNSFLTGKLSVCNSYPLQFIQIYMSIISCNEFIVKTGIDEKKYATDEVKSLLIK